MRVFLAFLLGLSLISPTYAGEEGEGGGGAPAKDAPSQTRGGRADQDRGGGEKDYDKSLVNSIDSAKGGGKGTPIDQIGKGQPTDPNNSYNIQKDQLRDRR